MNKYRAFFIAAFILLTSGVLPSCDLINEPEESIDLGVDKSKLEFTYNDKIVQYVQISNYREYWDCKADYGDGVAAGKEWINISANGSTLGVSVVENETSEERRAELIVTSRYRNPAKIEIIQEPMPTLTPQSAKLSFKWFDNEEQKINVWLVNITDWTVIPEKGWVKVNKFKEEVEVEEEIEGEVVKVKKIVEGITVNVDDNDSGEERKSLITFRAEGINDVTIEVVQDAEPSMTVDTDDLSFESSGNADRTINVKVVNVPDWTAVPNKDWVKVTKEVDNVTVNVDDNDSGVDRDAVITFSGTGVQDVTVNVIQLR